MSAADLKAMRTAAGYDQRTLARMLGVTQGAVSHWETGRMRIRTRDELAIRSVLGSGKVRARAVARSSSKSISSK